MQEKQLGMDRPADIVHFLCLLNKWTMAGSDYLVPQMRAIDKSGAWKNPVKPELKATSAVLHIDPRWLGSPHSPPIASNL